MKNERTRQERRINDKKAEKRKYNILRYVYRDRQLAESFKGQMHRLSKAKVHCSCPMCAFNGFSIADARNKEKASSMMAELA